MSVRTHARVSSGSTITILLLYCHAFLKSPCRDHARARVMPQPGHECLNRSCERQRDGCRSSHVGDIRKRAVGSSRLAPIFVNAFRRFLFVTVAAFLISFHMFYGATATTTRVVATRASLRGGWTTTTTRVVATRELKRYLRISGISLLSLKLPLAMRMMSMIVQIPQPPAVKSMSRPVPILPT